ncbi:MAG: hypothetical protein ACK559_10650, partial [bacterium]
DSTFRIIRRLFRGACRQLCKRVAASRQLCKRVAASFEFLQRLLDELFLSCHFPVFGKRLKSGLLNDGGKFGDGFFQAVDHRRFQQVLEGSGRLKLRRRQRIWRQDIAEVQAIVRPC